MLNLATRSQSQAQGAQSISLCNWMARTISDENFKTNTLYGPMMKLKKLNDEFSKDLSIMQNSTLSNNKSELNMGLPSKNKSSEIIPIKGVMGKSNYERMRNRVVFKKFISKEENL